MKVNANLLLAVTMAVASIGCAADVETTDDSTKMEVEGPKVEIGDARVDLDPRTDDDVDIDMPATGDK